MAYTSAKNPLLQSWITNHKSFEAQGRKLAIIAGPGGNAGVITSGLLAAMVQTDAIIPNAHYIGISVGAYNWMYLLIGRNFDAPTVYGRYYCDNRFINPWRLLTHKPVLNLDFVMNDIAEDLMPINYTAAKTTFYKVSALTTNSFAEPHFLPLTGVDQPSIQRALRATASMPWIGRSTSLHESHDWDGWLVEHQLLPYLQQQGITDVVWILNRPIDEPETYLSHFLWQWIIRRFSRYNPDMSMLIQQRLKAGDFLKSNPNLTLEVFAPPIHLSASCRNPKKLFHALGTSYRYMTAYLNQPDLAYPEEWEAYRHYMPQ